MKFIQAQLGRMLILWVLVFGLSLAVFAQEESPRINQEFGAKPFVEYNFFQDAKGYALSLKKKDMAWGITIIEEKYEGDTVSVPLFLGFQSDTTIRISNHWTQVFVFTTKGISSFYWTRISPESHGFLVNGALEYFESEGELLRSKRKIDVFKNRDAWAWDNELR